MIFLAFLRRVIRLPNLCRCARRSAASLSLSKGCFPCIQSKKNIKQRFDKLSDTEWGIRRQLMQMRIKSATLATLAFVLPTPAFADALQQQVLAGARAVSEEDFAFTQTMVNQRSGEGAKTYVARYDPKRPKPSRWTLISAEGRAPKPKESAQLAKQGASNPVPSYARIATWFGAPATRSAGSDGKVIYRFASLPMGTIKMGSHDASADAAAEALVNTSGKTPFVERVRVTMAKPFRMMMVAKIERVDATSLYRMLPDGRPVIVSTNSDMTGSVLGKSGSFKSRVSYTDMRAAR